MRDRGLTLLEVVVALALLAIGVTALQRLVATGVRTIGDDARLTRAMLLAQAILADASLHPPPPGHVAGERPGFEWERDITPTPHPALREIRVRVHDGRSGREDCELVEVVRVLAE